MIFTSDERECAADNLRRLEQGGKQLRLWAEIPKSTRMKWLAKVDCVLAAVERERNRSVRATK